MTGPLIFQIDLKNNFVILRLFFVLSYRCSRPDQTRHSLVLSHPSRANLYVTTEINQITILFTQSLCCAAFFAARPQ